MYVDPLLLALLVILLVVTSALAVVAYVRYRRCEDVYQAYGLRKRTPHAEPAAAPADDRYVTGADYAAEPVLAIPNPEPEASAPFAPQPLPLEAPEPEISRPDAPAPQPLFVPEETAAAESFFYEYTGAGFVPVDPYEPEPLPEAPGEEAEPQEGDEFSLSFAGEEMPEPVQPEPATPEPTSERDDGFVWL